MWISVSECPSLFRNPSVVNLSSVYTLRRWKEKLRRMLQSLWKEEPSTETPTSKSIGLMRLKKKLCSRSHKSWTPAFHTAKTACSCEGHSANVSRCQGRLYCIGIIAASSSSKHYVLCWPLHVRFRGPPEFVFYMPMSNCKR